MSGFSLRANAVPVRPEPVEGRPNHCRVSHSVPTPKDFGRRQERRGCLISSFPSPLHPSPTGRGEGGEGVRRCNAMISLNILNRCDRCSQLYCDLWDNLRIPAGAFKGLFQQSRRGLPCIAKAFSLRPFSQKLNSSATFGADCV